MQRIGRAILLAAVMLGLVWTPLGALQSVQRAEAATLTEVIQRNWSHWSRGQATVSYSALIDELANPSFKGEDAAALAALARHLRLERSKMPLSRAEAEELAAADTPTSKQYAAFVESLGTMSRELYTTGQPSFSALKQGPIGDCFFFSGIGWLAQYRPQTIVRAIEPLPNGQYRVSFPNGMKTAVNAPTDSEILFFNSASSITDGLWVTVLEKAVGAVLPNYTQRVVNNVEPAYNIALGGGPAVIEKIWTGESPTVIYLNKHPSRSEVREALIRVQQKNLMSQALTPARSIAHSVAGDHVYAILGFDKATDTLTIWNPWGDEYTPRGPEGIQNGYKRTHGVFTMPLNEFMEVYWILSVE